jgi:predicted protein tyrosine phosphatase
MSHHVPFICTHNIMRSRTGAEPFASWPDIETASAGTSPHADVPITPELLVELMQRPVPPHLPSTVTR